MFLATHFFRRALVAACSLALLSSCIHKKYETPIAKNTQQPDKVLFDSAMHDIEHGRYEVARISLQTLMNTYESSEYMAKAKLAVADSWFREGGSSGMAQAEAEYKDFILFYPSMEEAAEAQNRVCEIHVKQMDKSDRDITQTIRAEDECRQLLVQFPNSKFAPQAAQRLRDIQESLAEHEFVVGNFYWKREMNPAAANRLDALVDQYPLYSRADEALFEAGDAYTKMGPRFRAKAGTDFARILKEYPLGERADDAKQRLEDLEMPVPKADATAMARMKFEQENYRKPSMMARTTGLLHSGPDVSHAAKEGQPTMTDPKRTIPASIPVPVNPEATAEGGAGTATGTTEVTASTVGANSALDTKADARTASSQTATQQAPAPLPTNRDKELQRMAKERAKRQAAIDKKKKKGQSGDDQQAGQTSANPGQAPASQSLNTPSQGPVATSPVSNPAANSNPQQQPQ